MKLEFFNTKTAKTAKTTKISAVAGRPRQGEIDPFVVLEALAVLVFQD